jgi:hypothetical protein
MLSNFDDCELKKAAPVSSITRKTLVVKDKIDGHETCDVKLLSYEYASTSLPSPWRGLAQSLVIISTVIIHF